MDKFVVVVFPNETKAYEGTKALRELHDEGSITLYGTAVIERNSDGTIARKERTTEGPIGTALGGLLGGLIGLFGGPVGLAVGLVAGGVVGSARDLFELGVSNEFLESISRALTPGKAAVVAEISEEWVTPLDTRMAAVEGNVLRETRDDFIEDEIHRRLASYKADLAQRRKERAAIKAEKAASKLQHHIEGAEEKLRRVRDDARMRVDEYKREFDAKIGTLREQARHATPEARSRIEERIAEMRADEQKRVRKLDQAWKLIQEALHP